MAAAASYPDERTLADIRMEFIRNQAKLAIHNPKIEPNIAGTGVSEAQAKHNMNMLKPGYPSTIASIVETGNYPSDLKALLVADTYALQAPEILLTKLKEIPGDELTTRRVFSLIEEMWWDTEVSTPSVYRYNPEILKMKTQLMFTAVILLNRNVPDQDGVNERIMQWLTKNITGVQHTFEEVRPRPTQQQKSGWLRNPFRRK
jgi:hypothetical protein